MPRLITVLSTCLAALACAAPAHGATGWQPAKPFSDGEQRVDTLQVVVGSGGHAAVAWGATIDGFGRAIFLKRRTPDGIWGPAEEVSVSDDSEFIPGYSDSPSVVVDDAGNTLVTWIAGVYAGKHYMEAFVPSGKPATLGQAYAKTGGSGGGMRTDTHLLPTGEVISTWAGFDHSIHSIVRRPTGDYGPETVLPRATPTSSILTYDLAYGRDGTSVVSWCEQVSSPGGGGFWHRAMASVRRPGGSWSAPQLLFENQDPEQRGMEIEAAVARDGSANVMSFSYGSAAPRHRLASLAAGSSTFGEPRPLPAVDQLVQLWDLVADEPGRVSVLGFAGPYAKVKPVVVDVPVDGGPVTSEALGDDHLALGLFPQIVGAFDTDGGLHVGWLGRPIQPGVSLDERSDHWHVFRAFRPAGGSFSAVTRTPVPRGPVRNLAVAAGKAGDALTAWTADRYYGEDLFVSTLGWIPDPPPAPTVAPVPTPQATPGPSGSDDVEPLPSGGPPVGVDPTTQGPAPQAGFPLRAATPAQTGTNAAPVGPARPTQPSDARPLRATGAPVGCTIPDVRGLTVPQARRRLESANCSVGAVRFVKRGRAGRVVRQNTSGAVRANGFRVVLVVARRGR